MSDTNVTDIKAAKRKPSLRCIVVKRKDDGTLNVVERAASNALGDDPFLGMYGNKNIIEPPYDLQVLTSLPEYCGELRPALDAMITNIDRLGHRIIAKSNVQDLNAELPENVLREISIAENFFDNAILDNDVGTFTEFRSRLRMDNETTGNAYIEVIPTLTDSSIPAGLNHLPSWSMRLRKQDDKFTPYEVPRAVKDSKGNWSIKKFPTSKRFRQYVQIREYGAEGVYFKEWGDPRSVDCRTGDVVEPGSIEPEYLAHEVIHIKLYSTKSPYGLPRTIGQLFAIFGTRAAEEINYTTFENNQIPAMVLLGTNVAVTDGSVDRLNEFIEDRVQGNKNYATIVIVEAEPIGEGMRDPGSMKLELKPLVEHQHTDAMFQKYIESNMQSVRRAFRLPPVYLGRADEYNRSTSESSKKVAEEQIFVPERGAFDALMNNTIMMRLGVSSALFKSNSPSVSDNYELTQLLATAERSGGLTPRISRMIVERILGVELPEVPTEVNPDLPFTWTTLQSQLAVQSETKPSSNNVEKTRQDVVAELGSYISRLEVDKHISADQAILVRSKLNELAA